VAHRLARSSAGTPWGACGTTPTTDRCWPSSGRTTSSRVSPGASPGRSAPSVRLCIVCVSCVSCVSYVVCRVSYVCRGVGRETKHRMLRGLLRCQRLPLPVQPLHVVRPVGQQIQVLCWSRYVRTHRPPPSQVTNRQISLLLVSLPVCHGIELPFVFHSVKPFFNFSAGEADLSRRMVR
jgi:hypothetical protein